MSPATITSAQAYAGVTYDERRSPTARPILRCSPGRRLDRCARACGGCARSLSRRTGEGQYLDISLLDAYFHYHDMAVELVS